MVVTRVIGASVEGAGSAVGVELAGGDGHTEAEEEEKSAHEEQGRQDPVNAGPVPGDPWSAAIHALTGQAATPADAQAASCRA